MRDQHHLWEIFWEVYSQDKHTEAVVQNGPRLHLKLAAELDNFKSLVCSSGLEASKLQTEGGREAEAWHYVEVLKSPKRDQLKWRL